MTKRNSQTKPGKAAPVVRRSDFVYQALYDEIKDGRLAPGERLREQEISDRLGISRTPVREALNRLINDGIVQSVPNAGVLVQSLSHEEIKDLYYLRAALERLAATLACDKGVSSRQLETMKAANRRMEKELEKDHDEGCYRADIDFHHALMVLAGSRIVSEAFAKSHISIVSWRKAEGRRHIPQHQKAIKEHAAILQAIEKRDAARAARLCEQHVLDGFHLLMERVGEEGPESLGTPTPLHGGS